jgi:hypothetical protein
MSNRYKGGVISATPPTTTGGNDGVASGAWTLEQQMQAQAAGLWPNQPIFYIEDVFSTYLYAGNASTQTITNNINLSTKGGLVWIKRRDTVASGNYLATTVGGTSNYLQSNSTNPYETSVTTRITSFNTDGFSLGAAGSVNGSGAGYVSWTFRKQPKFFDVVTYTGDGTNGRAIAHSINGTVGMAIVKSTNNSGSGYDGWYVRHRSATGLLYLNLTNAQESGFGQNITALSNNSVTVGGDCNESGETYVMYVFAHDAGGFGLTGTDNVISCGSYTGDGTTDGSKLVSLGYEPQWVLVKRTDSSTNGDWSMIDTMRGMPTATSAASITALLLANSTQTEVLDSTGGPKATGFSPVASLTNTNGATYIYIAIRRGPMKVPTDATTVFDPQTTANGTIGSIVTPPVKDAVLNFALATPGWQILDRLRGIVNGFPTNTSGAVTTNPYLITNSTAAEASTSGRVGGFGIARPIAQAGTWYNGDTGAIANGNFDTLYSLQRAPSFMDVVCYTGGAGTPTVLNHNLAVPPELIITKVRNFTGEDWVVNYNNGSSIIGGYLNSTSAFSNSSTAPSTDLTNLTSATYTLNTSNRRVNGAYNYVAYLFATCPGVSKVGSYTGTATTLQIDCGFTAGSRFVLIKRTDSTGDWYVWDSARGIVAGNDPYLLLNSTAAEVTNTDYVDTYNAGFEITSTAPAGINANGGTYIFLAIA